MFTVSIPPVFRCRAINVPRRWLPTFALLLLSVVFTLGAGQSRADTALVSTKQAQFPAIDIDHYVATQRPSEAGTTVMIKPRPVSFSAAVKQYPRSREVTYLYTVLDFFPLDPRPEVGHRMFVTTPQGHIMPLYVEGSLVDKIKHQLSEGGDYVAFYGYHVYNYSKGPAILVTGFATVQALAELGDHDHPDSGSTP